MSETGQIGAWFGLLLLIAALVGGLAYCSPALSHEAPSGWAYDQGCCSARDCRQAEDGEVTQERDGYHYNGQLIHFDDKRIKNSGDHHFHVCEWPEGGDMSVEARGRMSVHCLYVPQPGV
ncbi:MAG TPA: hypothetical protein VFR36_05570 [Sphingomicrobium sp.]|nr:hypothetical protein [Sphingomicrobium sp.]